MCPPSVCQGFRTAYGNTYRAQPRPFGSRSSHTMLYICIPAYDEAPTVGLLLWRIRKVFQEFSREYEVLVFDDGSTDETAQVLEPYRKVIPLTVLGGREHVGYAKALETLLRTASKRTRYPRRDAVVVMQADFTDQPEHLPELVKRFEGGADIIVGEHVVTDKWPKAVRRLRRVAPWVLRPFVTVPGVSDPFGALRLYRTSVVRDLLKEVADASVVEREGWAANVELLLRTAKHARRIETVTLEPRYDLRPRDTRVRPLEGAMDLYRFGWASRARRASAVTR